MSTPIAVFAYNRPQHLSYCLEFLEQAQKNLATPLPMYIFCDAPKDETASIKVAHTREVAQKWVAAHGGEVIERERNLGFDNITEGITQLCKKYGQVIVVEDDVLVSPDFLTYMTAALKTYAAEPQVFMISGFMYADPKIATTSTFFLPTSFIWGWATWERAWRHYEKNPPEALEFLKKNRAFFDVNDSFPFSKILRKTLAGEYNTWDIQWMYCLYKHGALSLNPSVSMTWNCGVGGGTHGTDKDAHPLDTQREKYIHGTMQLDDFRKPRLPPPWAFPTTLTMDNNAYRRLGICFLKERIATSSRFKLKLWLRLAKAQLTALFPSNR